MPPASRYCYWSTPRRLPDHAWCVRRLSYRRAGERLGEHQVHERAWLVVSGAIEISEPGGETVAGGAGLLADFDPNERHEVAATEDARLLLVLSPWPGEGHPSNHGSG